MKRRHLLQSISLTATTLSKIPENFAASATELIVFFCPYDFQIRTLHLIHLARTVFLSTTCTFLVDMLKRKNGHRLKSRSAPIEDSIRFRQKTKRVAPPLTEGARAATQSKTLAVSGYCLAGILH